MKYTLDYEKYAELARRVAAEGSVLLRNEDNVLPLQKGQRVSIFGRTQFEHYKSGTGSGGMVNAPYVTNIIDSLKEDGIIQVNEALEKVYREWLKEHPFDVGEGWAMEPWNQEEMPVDEELAVQAAGQSDAAIVVIGRTAGEDKDNSAAEGSYLLTALEEELLRNVCHAFEHTIVVLNVGNIIDTKWVDRYQPQAVLYIWQGGQEGGRACVDVLTGKVNPSGKLSDTIAEDIEDYPSTENFGDPVENFYTEDIYVGYRYFTTFRKKAAYPFGYGLSYTEFCIRQENIRFDGEVLELDVYVKNVGEKAGKEVVQVYVGKPESELEQPEKELVFFEKTKELLPGEEQKISVHVPVKVLTSYSEEKAAYILSKGYYRIYVGNSIEAAECGGFDEEETRIIKQVTNLLCSDCKFTRLSKTNPDDTWPTGAHSGVVKNKLTFLPYEKRKHYPAKFDMEKPKEKVTFDAVRKNPSRAAEFVAQMSPEELARISVCASAGWGMEGIGEAGRVFQTEGYDLPDFPVSDGNSGVNLNVKNIGMPSGVTICASFNKELAEAIGCVIGEEAKALGVPLVLAPAFNIHRNPLNGRQPEYFSEDPYLSGVMAGFYAKGLEGAGVGGCYKHFIGNNCESSRKRNQSLISERAIREIYFRTFEYAMDVHMPASFMTAYNAVNGCPTAADEELLQGLLREENGFAGFVMTDWTTYDSVDVAAMVQAGNCWITPGSNDDTYTGQIKKGLENGTIDTARLQENVTALIRTMAKFS